MKKTSAKTKPKLSNNIPDQNDLIIEESQIVFHVDDRRYRIRGLEKNHSSQQLKLNGRTYELLYDGQGRDGKAFLLGLVDPAELKA